MKPFILFAEDDPNDVLLMKHALERAKLKITYQFVHDGRFVISWLAGDGPYADRRVFPLPSLIVTDLKMSEQGGFAVLRFVKAHPKLQHIPVIVLSSSTISTDIDKALNLGAAQYLVKDPTFTELLQSLASCDAPKLIPIRAA